MRYKEFSEASWSTRIGGPKTTGGDRELAQSQQLIQQLQQAYQQKFKRSLQINSTYRTRQYQQQLVQRYRNGEKGIYMPADPNRNPDAKYFHLFSVDVRLPRNEEQWMNKQGWVRPDPIRDPVHFQYAGNTNQTPAPRIKQTGFDRMAIDRIRSRLQRLGLAVKP